MDVITVEKSRKVWWNSEPLRATRSMTSVYFLIEVASRKCKGVVDAVAIDGRVAAV